MRKILVLVLLFGLIGLAGGFVAKASTTNMSQTISSGTKSVSSDATATLTGLTVSHSAQTATGSFDIDPKNTIGDGASYSVTMTSTNFTTIGGVQTVAGSNDTVSTSGTYDGTYGISDPSKRYEIVITTGGAVGAAVFKWRVNAEAWTEGVTTAASVLLEKGISVTFGAATYVVDDAWEFGVDVFPYTSLTVTPGSITADSGSTSGMTAGSEGALSGSNATSDAKTLISTEDYRGMGDYAQTESLSLSVHGNPMAGTYNATATITIL